MLDHELCQSEAQLRSHAVLDAIESLRPPLPQPTPVLPANYNTPEGVLFRKAMGLIEDERNWCQDHVEMLGDSGNARYCLVGALNMAESGNSRDTSKTNVPVYNAIRRQIGYRLLSDFNNTHTHAENMAMLRACGKTNGWLT